MFESPTHHKTILVIEDNDSDFLIIKKALTKTFPDFNIFKADDIGDAYTKFKSARYDLVLLDLNLPDGFGLGTIQNVKSFHTATPVIAVTGGMTDVIKEKAQQMGASAILSKDDILTKKFSDTIKRILLLPE